MTTALQPLTVGGRTYEPALPRCWGQVIAVTTLLRQCGITGEADPGTIMDLLLEHEKLPHLIASHYRLPGRQWSKADAEQLAGRLYAVTEPDEIALLEGTTVAVLMDFFGLADAGPRTSHTFSDPAAVPSENAATTTSEATAPSSAA